MLTINVITYLFYNHLHELYTFKLCAFKIDIYTVRCLEDVFWCSVSRNLTWHLCTAFVLPNGPTEVRNACRYTSALPRFFVSYCLPKHVDILLLSYRPNSSRLTLTFHIWVQLYRVLTIEYGIWSRRFLDIFHPMDLNVIHCVFQLLLEYVVLNKLALICIQLQCK